MSCCGKKSSKLYTRQNLGKVCCDYDNDCTCNDNRYSQKGCCNQSNSCCDYNSNNNYSNYNSCCNSNQKNSYSSNNCCYNSNSNSCCDYSVGLDGISCPFHNNNDCCCENSLADALCRLTNQRVIIHVDGCKMCVVIVSVGKCFVKAINPCSQKIVYFNINRIDNVEDVLPRCY
ncbi:MAG: hypothetical protein E7231_06735 [Cellulosilyticum sp.]|nr:hypothetical protein [Cellulosilyticum sp.]